MMKPVYSHIRPTSGMPATVSGSARIPVLVVICFLLGAVSAGIWFKHAKPAGPGQNLSDNTLALLHQLNAPVELRFYSVLPPGTAPEALQAFSGRVDRMLSGFQSANDAKIHVTRNISTEGANADAAAADGIRPFNLDKGDACFLGLAVVSGNRKEILARLQPEWESALEFDVARAIATVAAAQPAPPAKTAVPVSPDVTNAVVRLIPDLRSTSLEDGSRILHEAALKDFTAAGTEMEKEIQAAQQQLADAQNGQSEAAQQAALKQLQDVQLQQGEKYKQIAARLQAELSLFQQMKAAER